MVVDCCIHNHVTLVDQNRFSAGNTLHGTETITLQLKVAQYLFGCILRDGT